MEANEGALVGKSARDGLRWAGDRSACGHYMIQTAHIRHQGTEHRVLYSAEGGPPYTISLAIYDTRREAKACAQRHADGCAEKRSPDA